MQLYCSDSCYTYKRTYVCTDAVCYQKYDNCTSGSDGQLWAEMKRKSLQCLVKVLYILLLDYFSRIQEEIHEIYNTKQQ